MFGDFCQDMFDIFAQKHGEKAKVGSCISESCKCDAAVNAYTVRN